MGEAADEATRSLTRAWVRAWDELAGQAQTAIGDLVAEQARLGRWPQPWELSRVERLVTMLTAAEAALAQLGTRTGVEVSDAAGAVIKTTADHDPRLISSQLPAGEQGAATERFASRLLPSALDAIVSRTQASIVSQSRALAPDAMEAMRRELIAGVATGASPRETAQLMVQRTEGAFNGGLGRATVIARTEVLDAYRTTSRYSHSANADVLQGWRWACSLDKRVCPACLSKNGELHQVTEPGPLGHQQCRCARLPVTRSWADLGIHGMDEPAGVLPDARAWFDGLPEDEQLAIMGPGRLHLLRSGKTSWDDLATLRTSTEWRPSYGPTSVRDLQRRAGVPQTDMPRRVPQSKPLPKRVKPAPTVALPDDVKLGDLFMASYTEKSAVTQARQAAVEKIFNGEYGGLRVLIQDVKATESRISVDGIIVHPDGRHVGVFDRAYYRQDGDLFASHSLLELNREIQGQGFSEAFNGHLIDWYRRSGVDRIVLHANIDVGGYAWARSGYDFKTADDAQAIMVRLEGKLDAYRKVRARLLEDGEDVAALDRQIAAGEDIVNDSRRFQFGEPGYPTAYRISQAGRWTGAGRDDLWIGKETLLRSSWKGVKPL